jgi:hypothetical protein
MLCIYRCSGSEFIGAVTFWVSWRDSDPLLFIPDPDSDPSIYKKNMKNLFSSVLWLLKKFSGKKDVLKLYLHIVVCKTKFRKNLLLWHLENLLGKSRTRFRIRNSVYRIRGSGSVLVPTHYRSRTLIGVLSW